MSSHNTREWRAPRSAPRLDLSTALRTAAAAVRSVRAKDPAVARRISLAVGRLQGAAQRVEGERIAAGMAARGRRQLDQTAAQDAMAQMNSAFDALDAILNAIGPVRQQLDDVRTLIRNLIASSLETDPQVKAAVAGTSKAHTTNVSSWLRQQRIVVRKSALRKS